MGSSQWALLNGDAMGAGDPAAQWGQEMQRYGGRRSSSSQWGQEIQDIKGISKAKGLGSTQTQCSQLKRLLKRVRAAFVVVAYFQEGARGLWAKCMTLC